MNEEQKKEITNLILIIKNLSSFDDSMKSIMIQSILKNFTSKDINELYAKTFEN